MRSLLTLLLGAVFAVPLAQAQPQAALRVSIFPGGLSWPIFVAQDRKLFEKEALAVVVTETPNSVYQIKGVMAGDFDIAMTPFDNVMAYDEGQGEVVLAPPPDLFSFMGGISSALRFIVRSEIHSFDDLKGKTLGVDALTTGYTLLMYQLLAQQGLPVGSYQLERTGGTSSRVQALIDGKIVGTMVSSPQEIIPEKQGFKRLGDIQAQLGNYQALTGAARRSWAATHQQQLIGFIRAYVSASQWLAEPANKLEAQQIYQRHIANTPNDVIETAWHLMRSNSEGFQADAKFDPQGAQMALDVRNRYGVPRKAIADWHRFVDESYYEQAIKAH